MNKRFGNQRGPYLPAAAASSMIQLVGVKASVASIMLLRAPSSDWGNERSNYLVLGKKYFVLKNPPQDYRQY
jgi:hypothetical protein